MAGCTVMAFDDAFAPPESWHARTEFWPHEIWLRWIGIGGIGKRRFRVWDGIETVLQI